MPVSSKPTEVRMGKGGKLRQVLGDGSIGRIMFEIDGVNDTIAREALRLGAQETSPVLTRIVAREDW